ncbi:MFS transporter [Pseudarthrobacter enclensis]|uniref:MFS family permease n=1 Tax=Pseudarthrobacter enclensis TaxID=993070 RepID=A0ABT9RRG5_9MICC|nr:MFS transporter [Pseudarthrobacter enclensis]MDP9887820.1 MFS family permease [Pseudarthrobacter enclensis]
MSDDVSGSPPAEEAIGSRRRVSDMFRALHERNFALFWTGQLVSGTGTWMQTVAMAWLVLTISKSAAVLGLVTMLQFLPMLLFVLPAGVVADRISKWKILLAAQSLAALQAIVLGSLLLEGTPEIWQLAVLAAALGLSNAFNNPAQQAFIAEMVGGSLTADAVAVNSVQFNATRMIGSGLGGVAVAQLPAYAVFFINGASFGASLLALVLMRRSDLRKVHGENAKGLGALREGLGFAFRTPPVFFILGSVAIVGTLGFNWPVAGPLIADRLLGIGPDGFGALMSALGVGSLAAGLGLVVFGGGTEHRIIASGALLAVFLTGLGISPSYPLSLALMFLAGLSGTTFTTTVNARLQSLVPDRLRGRIMSLFVLLLIGSTPVGASLLGLGAETLGATATLVLFGVSSGLGLGVMVLVHRLRTVGRDER